MDLGHSGDVVLERGHLVNRLGRVESEELGNLGSVGGVLVDTELEVLGEGRVELVKVLLVLGNLRKELKSLLDEVLLDDLEDLVLLESLTRNVEGKVLRLGKMSVHVFLLVNINKGMMILTSTTPTTKLRYSGIKSSLSSEMKTRRT